MLRRLNGLMQPEASQEGSAKQFERDHLWISKLVKI